MYDIAVIGDGPAAMAAAYTLAKAKLDVVIIGSQKENNHKAFYGETISSIIGEVLMKLDVQGISKSEIGKEIGFSMSVWGSNEKVYKSEFLRPDGLSWVLNRDAFTSILQEKCKQKFVQFIKGTIIGLSKENGVFSIKVDSIQEDIKSKVLINATGRIIAKLPFVARKVCIDKLIAVIFTIEDDTIDEPNELQIEACENGWFYSIKPKLGFRTITYFTDGDLIYSKKKEYWANFFITEIEKLALIKKNISRQVLEQCAYFSVVSANSSFRLNLYDHGVMFIGDSGQTFDPLSSQGISFAISDGIDLAIALVDYFKGTQISLINYEINRRKSFIEYLKNRHAYYSMEKRWKDSEFWKRRHNLEDLKVIQKIYY